jgi:hypothetical protein
VTAKPSAIEGAWQITSYTVKAESTAVDGVLLLVDGHWSTLYFVAGAEGPWGSAEAGRYEFDGQAISFLHRLMFQGGGGRPLHVTQSASHVEVCPTTITGDAVTIQFPSGSTLVCHRLRAAQVQ